MNKELCALLMRFSNKRKNKDDKGRGQTVSALSLNRRAGMRPSTQVGVLVSEKSRNSSSSRTDSKGPCIEWGGGKRSGYLNKIKTNLHFQCLVNMQLTDHNSFNSTCFILFNIFILQQLQWISENMFILNYFKTVVVIRSTLGLVI